MRHWHCPLWEVAGRTRLDLKSSQVSSLERQSLWRLKVSGYDPIGAMTGYTISQALQVGDAADTVMSGRCHEPRAGRRDQAP